MKNTLSLIILAFSLLALLSACGVDQMTPSEVISVTLTPSTATVYVTESVQFTATVHNSTNGAVTWNLSGAGCGGATCGTISSTGLYTAPATAPSPWTKVTVKATSAADTSKSAHATITIQGPIYEWTWVSGSDIGDRGGVYGSKGTADPSNVPGGRQGAVSWIDSGDNFWLFGGYGHASDNTGLLNDLWKYDPTSDEWTWVSGSNLADQLSAYGTKGLSDPSNVPAGRWSAVSWIDPSGNLWLFGGLGHDSAGNSGLLNDLWKYDPTTDEWTWVSGSNLCWQPGVYGTKGLADPSNIPGGRWLAVSWIDSSGNLWLFGGIGYDSAGTYADLNDLWKFDPTSDEWTWISGSTLFRQLGVYGTKGLADPSNVPGARHSSVSWIDSNGNLWLFGGSGCDSINWGSSGLLNDLWRYDPTTQEWTWVSGSSIANQGGVYGAIGYADPSNVPPGRTSAVSWIDTSGNLWLFGGYGGGSYPSGTTYSGRHNDLWKYDPTTGEWTWVSGGAYLDHIGIYGTQHVAGSANVPGGRTSAVSWIDSSGNLWLFGGSGCDSTTWNTFSLLNDLWIYTW